MTKCWVLVSYVLTDLRTKAQFKGQSSDPAPACSPSELCIPVLDSRKHGRDGSHLSSYPSPGLTIWDLNSPYHPHFLIAALPRAHRQLYWADWSLPHLTGKPVGETPAELGWQNLQQKTEICRLLATKLLRKKKKIVHSREMELMACPCLEMLIYFLFLRPKRPGQPRCWLQHLNPSLNLSNGWQPMPPESSQLPGSKVSVPASTHTDDLRFSSALGASRTFTASWKKLEAFGQISGRLASRLCADRDTNEKQILFYFFCFLVSRLQNDVLRSAGSTIKVSRGAGSRTFDVPDLRSGR